MSPHVFQSHFVVAAVRWLPSAACLLALLFVSAGSIDLGWHWAYVICYSALALGPSFFWTAPSEAKDDPHSITDKVLADRGFVPLVSLLLALHWMIAGLDQGRFHWSAEIPFAWRLVSFIAMSTSLGFRTWAIARNRFFWSDVRWEATRGQQLVIAGPYRIVRHPGYAGMIAAHPLGACALGSWWSLIPLVLFVPLIIRRTAREDRFLLEILPDYAGYAIKVPFRLLPGVW